MKQTKETKKVESIYRRVREILETARSSAYRAANFAMVQAYWNIGREIVEEEQKGKVKTGYGEYLMRDLSGRLTKDFGKGFTISNVKYFRQFYLSFSIGHALRDELPLISPELSWTHYRLLLKVERPDIRKFYLDECIQNNWSTRQLERQINSFYYERILSSRDKKAVRKEIHKFEPSLKPEDIIKDPYVLEFLVPIGLASYDTSTPKPRKYEYDPHLDPQIVWAGKAEYASFKVLTVFLSICKRIFKFG